MKTIIALFIFTVLNMNAQEITLSQWNIEAKTNVRLLPKYGLSEKTEAQKLSDEKFIEATMKEEQFKGNRRAASNHLIKLGFNYYYKGDIKMAMYRFNQAYILDNNNTDIYWGYGAIYMALKYIEKGTLQYEEGLKLNPKNTHILNDYANYFLGRYYNDNDKIIANAQLNTALEYLKKSYAIDADDTNTLYKLSVIYFLKNDCKNALKYHNDCKKINATVIAPQYTESLDKQCSSK